MSGAPTDARTRLLNTATKLLSGHGYQGTSIKDVLAASGTVAGSLYHHFPDGKEGLAIAAILRSGELATAVFDQLFAELGVAGAVDAYFDVTITRLAASDFLDGCPIGTPAADAPGISDAVRRATATAFTGWRATMTDHLVADGWSRDTAGELASNVVSLYEGSILLARAERDLSPVEAAARLTRSILADDRSIGRVRNRQ